MAQCKLCDVVNVVWTSIMICSLPPLLNNGYWAGPDVPYPGAVYNFKCDEGFIPTGSFKDNLELVCMENGSYSLDETELPFCAEGCENPDQIANGSYVESLTNEYMMGDQLTYTCDAGYSQTSDSKVIGCDSGVWNLSQPACLRVCPAPDAVTNATFEISTSVWNDEYLDGVQVSYICDESYLIYYPTEKSPLTCTSEGLWSDTPGQCTSYCGDVMTLDGGNSSVISSVVVNDTLTIPKRITYSCSGTTFHPPGYEEWTCLDNGQWNHNDTEIQCLTSCPEPATSTALVISANQVQPGSYLEGTTLELSCEANYVMSDYRLATSVCESDTSWNNMLPTCVLDCSPAPEIDRGSKNVTLGELVYESEADLIDGRLVELQVEYECDDNHQLVPPDQPTLTCGSNATWPTLTAQCLVVCSSPATVSEATYQITKSVLNDMYLDGVEVSYSCNQPHLIFYPTQKSTLTCMSDSLWSDSPGQCTSYCGDPALLDGGTHSVIESVAVNETLTIPKRIIYSCSGTTFHPPGYEDSICLDNGQWDNSNVTIECLTDCPTPSPDFAVLINATQTQEGSYLERTTLQVSCEPNWILSNYALNSSVCQSDGTWSNPLPTCVPDCGTSALPYGTINVVGATDVETAAGTVSYPQTATFSCDSGFILIPTGLMANAKCSPNTGTFGEFEINPMCVKECPSPPEHDHADFILSSSVLGSNYYSGSQVTYSCHENFIMPSNGSDILTCDYDGNWSGVLDTCYRICPAASVIDSNVIKSVTRSVWIHENLTLEQTVSWSCPDDRTLVPAVSEWTCEDTGLWSSTTPVECLKTCPRPPQMRHGDRTVVSGTEILSGAWVQGEEIVYACESDEYVFTDPTDIAFLCQDDGTWNMTTTPECLLENSATRQCSVDYEFFFTDNLGNYTTTREECLSKGADLFHENFGFEPHGDRYHEYLRNFTYFDSYDLTHYWVGVTDLETEGTWQFVDGTEYDWTKPVTQLFSWNVREPNNLQGLEHCMEITRYNLLNDGECFKVVNLGLCEKKIITCV